MLPIIAPQPTASSLRLTPALGAGLDSTMLSRWRKAKGRVRAGSGDAWVGIVGDSTEAGQGANTGTSGLTSARTYAPSARLAAQFTAMGLRASSDNVFGNNVVDSTNRVVSAYTTYNPAVVVSVNGTSDWFVENLTIPGGYCWRNTSGTGAWSFTPTEAFDTIDVYFINATGNGVATVDIGGAALATIDTSATVGGLTAVVKTTVSTGAAAATGTINIKRTGTGGLVRLMGIVARNSGISKVHVVNLGACGWSSVEYSDATGPWSPGKGLQYLGFDLFLINLGLNDAAHSYTAASYYANILAIANFAKTNGADVVLVIPPPQDPVTRDPSGLTSAYTAQLQSIAATLGCNMIDLYSRFGGYTKASAAGYYYDTVHMLKEGYADKADAYARSLFAA